MALINLDSLRAEKKEVRFLGRTFDLGYIPSGISIPLTTRYNAMIREQAPRAKDPEALKKYAEEEAAAITAENIALVAIYTSFYDPEIDAERIAREASREQVEAMLVHIVEAIVKSSGVVKAGTNTRKKKSTGRR
ncbi:MAG: hypothetical protein HC888_09335 [Candidatus Competibacteraceae bacterium]|nr:hypothetical protein [Candidatus Competibacteraceae bacterium]